MKNSVWNFCYTVAIMVVDISFSLKVILPFKSKTNVEGKHKVANIHQHIIHSKLALKIIL